MTNKEHLSTLPANEWSKRVDWLYHIYGNGFNHTMLAVEDWLDKEYSPVKPLKHHSVTNIIYLCPICYSQIPKYSEKCTGCYTDLDWSQID